MDPNHSARRAIARPAAVLLAVAMLLVPALSANAVTTAGWASWEPLDGSAGAYSTTMQLPATGFPAAAMSSDSRSGSVGVQTGASIWLGASTPPGEVFGSSRDQPYLNLRPRVDNASSPSTTTYTFEHPAPPGSWALVMGDIDADRAVVTARGPDGQLLTGAELGWQGGFNYCIGAGTPSCTGDEDDIATWDPDTGEVLGNLAGVDTSGASGWFRPTAPISSLTISFFHRNGFPVYQTWFASLARDITGTVTHDEDGPLADAELTLFDVDGRVVATTTSGADGSYAFEGIAATAGYTVEVRPPGAPAGEPGYVVAGPATLPADLLTTDATAVDFVVRDIVPAAVSGFVTTPGGEPVPGAVVTLTGTDDVERTATSDSTGAYVIDAVPVGEHTFSVVPPAGYGVVSVPDPIDVPAGSEEPIVDQDVVLQPAASVSGTVTAGAQPVPGATVTITGPGGSSVLTGADGSYSFEMLPPGEYEVTVVVPEGYSPDGPITQEVTVGATDVADVDFALQRPGAVGGAITDGDGNPVAGVTITLTGPGGEATTTTDAAGNYLFDEVPSGEYTATIVVPEGFEAELTSWTVTITNAGEQRLDLDFALLAVPVEVPVSGTVTDAGGEGVPGVEIVVTDAAGVEVATAITTPDGSWDVVLPPGTGYVSTITVPEGYEIEGGASLTFDVGADPVTGLDFVVALVDEEPPASPAPTDPPSSVAPAPTGPGGALPDTGAEPGAKLILAGSLLGCGLLTVAMVRSRARKESQRH